MVDTNGKKKETNVSIDAASEVEMIKIHITLQKGQRFTTVEFSKMTGLDILLKDDEARRKRLAQDFIKMLAMQGSIEDIGVTTTHRKGRALIIYRVVSPVKWTLEVGQTEGTP